MRWDTPRPKPYEKKWRRHFAWFPTAVGNETVWWEYYWSHDFWSDTTSLWFTAPPSERITDEEYQRRFGR